MGRFPNSRAARYLCPAGVAGILQAPTVFIAAAAQEAGRTTVITVAEAKRWRADPTSAKGPDAAVIAAVQQLHAERASKRNDRSAPEQPCST
jgi:hypothetical protein